MLNFNFVNKILNLINNHIITTKNRFNFIIFNNNYFYINSTILMLIQIKLNN